ncbi:LacI family DNA-binding transcriptional regulator [Nonomuraea angiospora]|uniref:DNA-binding LacI/PurR family transcriptional regulator n=1 Tax=Nonomuraea angiospora TaxID=46172 RepID=A0ABR9LTE7_9ACTN|nr:LacI family DNA-binding transcriptional regulator [Nonomuraea angiospora]MBE1583938.1 DNA-binding LacI/PurR family transcriptional regulator [Nonomuraea angiospora]
MTYAVRMRVTMREVADRAGVSIKTVSRVVNGEPHIRPEKVRRVHAAIDELGWVPNRAARALRTGQVGVVGIAVTELRRPYLAGLVEALVTEADRWGMLAAVEPTHGDPARLAAVLAARGRTFDGVVLIGPAAPVADGLGERPVVVVRGDTAWVDRAETDRTETDRTETDRTETDRAGVDRVEEDVAEAAALLARHLAVMGRSRPALLGARQDELRARLGGSGPVPVPCAELGEVADRRAGARAAVQVLERHPDVDVLLCVNDEVALGALAALVKHGVDVPGRVAVAGYGNLEDGRFSTPSLTTIDPGPARLARSALELLADRLAGTAPRQPRAVVSPVELIRRESTLGRDPR